MKRKIIIAVFSFLSLFLVAGTITLANTSSQEKMPTTNSFMNTSTQENVSTSNTTETEINSNNENYGHCHDDNYNSNKGRHRQHMRSQFSDN